jgi:hypothetical protein
MKVLLWFCLLPFGTMPIQTVDLDKIRGLYHRAAEIKQDAAQLNQLMLQVDSGSAVPVLICYKGANEIIQAKYSLNPIVKLEKFNKGKELIKKAINRDMLNLEIRFIRYSIQSNLPAFLGYHDDLSKDKQFLLDNTMENKDPKLKEMIFNYLSALPVINPDKPKQLKN